MPRQRCGPGRSHAGVGGMVAGDRVIAGGVGLPIGADVVEDVHLRMMAQAPGCHAGPSSAGQRKGRGEAPPFEVPRSFYWALPSAV